MSDLVWIEYRELSAASEDSMDLPSLRDCASAQPQEHEEDIVRYLETAPAYSGLGKIVGDVLDPSAKAVLFPGRRTDGVYVWPAELSYYVLKYHIRLPQGLIERMVSRNWRPPIEEDIDWEKILQCPSRK